MKKWVVYPLKNLNEIKFAMKRDEVREIINCPYREIRKSMFSENTMDVYKGYHISYDENDCLESVEFFSDVEIYVNGRLVFPGSIKTALSIFDDLFFDGYGYISRSYSVGIGISDDNDIESILFGNMNYYQ